MKAVKVYNNSAVSTVAPDGREAVVIGSGIGFGKRPGDTLDESKIEKIYYIQDELQTRFLQLLKDTRREALCAAEDILGHARQMGLEVGGQVLLALTDHISFALDRQEQGLTMPYLMLSETRMLYPREYEAARWGLAHIAELCGVQLPDYEAGYLALQLACSSTDRDTAFNTLKLVSGALDIIKNVYGVELDPNDIDTLRLTTHLKFLARRIFTHAQWQDKDVADLYDLLIFQHRKNRICLERLRSYIRETFAYTLNPQEEVYLLIHLSKIL